MTAKTWSCYKDRRCKLEGIGNFSLERPEKLENSVCFLFMVNNRSLFPSLPLCHHTPLTVQQRFSTENTWKNKTAVSKYQGSVHRRSPGTWAHQRQNSGTRGQRPGAKSIPFSRALAAWSLLAHIFCQFRGNPQPAAKFLTFQNGVWQGEMEQVCTQLDIGYYTFVGCNFW